MLLQGIMRNSDNEKIRNREISVLLSELFPLFISTEIDYNNHMGKEVSEADTAGKYSPSGCNKINFSI